MIYKHVALRGHETVRPTARMLRYWWSRLNTEVFADTLHVPKLTVLRVEWPDVYGLCWPLSNSRSHIQIDPTLCATRGDILATLAHEMIHQWQHQLGEPMTHGESFKGWADAIRDRTGLEV